YRGASVEFCFKHALTQSTAYEGLLLRQRRDLHARVLRSLKTQHDGGLDEFTELLAYHAFRAELWPEALCHSHKAGKQANEVSAHDVAIPQFEHALTALGHLPATRENASLGID